MVEVKEKKNSEQQLVEKIRKVPVEFDKIDPARLAEEVSNARCANANFYDKIEGEKFGALVKAISSSIEAEAYNFLCDKKIVEINTKAIGEFKTQFKTRVFSYEDNLQKNQDEINRLKGEGISKSRNVIEDAKSAIKVLGDDRTAFSRALLFHSLFLERMHYMNLADGYMEDLSASVAMLSIGDFIGVKSPIAPPSVLEATIGSAVENGMESQGKLNDVNRRLEGFAGIEKEPPWKWITKFKASLYAQLLPKFITEAGLDEKDVKQVTALINLDIKEMNMTPQDKLKIVDEGMKLVKPELVLEWGSYAMRNAIKKDTSIFAIESEVNVMRALSEGKTAEDAIATIIPELKELYENLERGIVNDVAKFHTKGDELQKWWNKNRAKEAKTFSKRN